MHWELSEEQKLFTDSLAEWLRERADTEVLRKWLDSGDSSSFQQAFRADGWAGVGFDEAIGGEGGGLLELALTSREMGRNAGPSSAWLQTAILAPAIAEEPDLIGAVLGGKSLIALASPADRLPGHTTVQCDQGHLTGRIPMVLAAAEATALVVPVRRRDDVRLWLIDTAAEGVAITSRHLLDRSRSASDVTLDGVAGRELDIDTAGKLDEIVTRAAVLVAADALGSAERMLALTVDYSKQRKQFGQPIGAFQAVKHAAAQMLVTVESSTSIVFYAAQSAQDSLPERALHAAVAKAQVTRGVAELADTALTLHGAIGFTWEHDLQLFYKRAKLDRALFGAPAVWNERIAAALPLLPATI